MTSRAGIMTIPGCLRLCRGAGLRNGSLIPCRFDADLSAYWIRFISRCQPLSRCR